MLASLLLIVATVLTPAPASANDDGHGQQADSVQGRETVITPDRASQVEVYEARRQLRIPELSPAACWGFLTLGSFLLWEVVEDDLWILTLTIATLSLAGLLLGATLFGAAGLLLGMFLFSTGASPIFLLVLGGAGMGLGASAGFLSALPAAAALGFALSIDEGEISLAF